MRLDVQSEVGPPEEAFPTGEALQWMYLQMLVEGHIGNLVHFAGRADVVPLSPLGLLFDDDLGFGLVHGVKHF